MVFRSCALLASVIAATAALGSDPALGQTSPAPADPTPPQSASPRAYTLIHVSAVAGSDTSGDGTQLRPYQTITYALRTAAPNSLVTLAPGEYSETSGETFPITLKPGVTVQGAPGPGINQAVIRGSGIFSSAADGLMRATIVGVDAAGLGNVTVTNTDPAGYGLVVEAGSPVIRDNTFEGSGYGGAYLTGAGTPVIQGNHFTQNGVVGLAIAGRSTAEVRENLFDNTGIGIRVAPGAQPNILNNRIVQDQGGIILDDPPGNGGRHSQGQQHVYPRPGVSWVRGWRLR
ncbi:MAG: DUF1565 domain-containing protein [Nodosilinea sp.]